MKRKFLLLSTFVFTLVLSACWPGEIGVSTVIDENGAGHRDFFLVVYDDSLSANPITNPDDPDGSKGNGPVLNNKHITGGVTAIQDWFEENAPSFMEVLPMRTEGLQRIFTLRMEFDSFEQFLSQYEQLVNLSPNLSWSDFTAAEKPTLAQVEVDGELRVTFRESTEILQASFDWAIDGIYNSIFLEADLAGFLDKASITQFATYNLEIGDETLNIESVYNETAQQVVFIDQASFTLTGSFDVPANNTLLIALIAAGVLVVAGGLFFVFKKKA